ncbi:MAG: extracellular solute-binding protein [Deltaproteobacteria bacterium]|nr:extracellular solute-binding protein [Deltaproteobacteria bacterium]
MKIDSFALFLTFILLSLASWVTDSSILAAVSDPAILQAKKEAEVKGHVFFTTHDEIVAMAKKEGKLRVMTGLEKPNFKPLMNAFKQKYPFLTDIHVEDIQGTEADQRFILEMKSGQAKGWDITHIPLDLANEYMPYLMRHDILGMAKHGVLKIDPRMIHPGERNIVSVTTNIRLVAYNRKLISEDKVPAKWEDFLGLERTLDFARKLAAQQPVWGRGAARIITAIAAGEYSLFPGASFNLLKTAMGKDQTGSLNYKIIEPVPTRIIEDGVAILNTADHPHVALLWLEFLTSPEGQEIIDKYEPFAASVFTPGSVLEQVTRGKKLSVIDWDHFTKFQEYQEKIFAAYGFPKAGK